MDWIKYVGYLTLVALYQQHVHKNITKDLVESCLPADEFLPAQYRGRQDFKDEVYRFVLKTELGVEI